MSEPGPSADKADARARGLKFEIQIGEGRGSLLLRPRTFFDWLRVERLEFEIPRVCFPLDITQGMAQFQRQRCRVAWAVFSVDDRALAALLREQVALLGAGGFEDVRLRL